MQSGGLFLWPSYILLQHKLNSAVKLISLYAPTERRGGGIPSRQQILFCFVYVFSSQPFLSDREIGSLIVLPLLKESEEGACSHVSGSNMREEASAVNEPLPLFIQWLLLLNSLRVHIPPLPTLHVARSGWRVMQSTHGQICFVYFVCKT